MTKSSARWAIFFANLGHTLTHLMMLLYPTVVLTLESRFGMSYGTLLWLSVPGVVLFGASGASSVKALSGPRLPYTSSVETCTNLGTPNSRAASIVS